MSMRTVAMIMAGGKGSRLVPLTVHRSKPAVPYGGRYRIVDFVLSNFVNSGYRRIYVLTQYMASSLIKHLNRNWRLSGIQEFIEVVPAQMRLGEFWYRGTADSVYQNLNLVRDARARNVAVFGGDHIYKFAIDQMEEHHEALDADLTIAAFPVPIEEASRFGVIQCDASGRVVGFQEKPANPTPMPGRPGFALVSMGNYLFKSQVLQDSLERDARDPNSSRDFGKDVIPALVAGGARVFIYDFDTNQVPGEPTDAPAYWRDVGTIDSYYQANMELRSPLPKLNIYNRQWRIRTAQRDYPPARFVQHGLGGSVVRLVDSLVCEGTIIQSTDLTRSILGYDCFIQAQSLVEDSIMLSGCHVGRGSTVRRVLCDKNVRIEGGTEIGVDESADRERFPWVTPSGIVVLPKGTVVPKEGPIRFASDIYELLSTDPHARDRMAEFADRIEVASRDRHSYFSAGPRYRTGDEPEEFSS